MTKSPRHSRYHSSGNPPPYLDSVLKNLRKAANGQGHVNNRGTVRALAARANSEYGIRGRADDLVRFLLNSGVLIELPDDGRLFVDAERMDHVLDCCDSGKEPSVADDPAHRVRAILKQAAEAARPVGSPAPDPARPAEDAVLASPGPSPSPTVGTVELTHVFYLTSEEEDVWNTLALLVEECADGLCLSLPLDDETRRAWCAQHLKCGEAFFADVLRRLVLGDVMRPCSALAVGTCRWMLTRSPFSYHTVSIPSRPTRRVKQLDIDIARALEREFIPRSDVAFGPAFKAFIQTRFPQANVGTFYTKMVTYKPAYSDKYWGILYRHEYPGGVRTLICVPGFEGLVLTTSSEAAGVQPSQSAPRPEAASAAPEARQPAAPPPEPPPAPRADEAPPVSIRQLSTEQEEQRRRIIEGADDDRLTRIISESETLLENLKRTLAEAEAERKRREEARLEHLRTRRAALAEERGRLAARLAEIDVEVEGIDAQLKA